MEKKSIEIGFLLVFPIFFRSRLLLMSCSHAFTKNGTKYLFSMQTDSSRIIAHSISLQFCDKKRIMAMSKEEMEKET